jgi:hypothetical protein
VESDLKFINQKIQQLSADVALLKAQQKNGHTQINPWIPLTDAASRLNFTSGRALRNRIKNGLFPPDCYCVDPTASGKAPKYLVHVERYIKQLR